ncbi:MarR family winged helix-turn-helix transcriptional regulator [Rhodocista pekingensis]|uniref:MarR family winged helix-turn-helix transcriptional regulator n=1 Tax=Rhodocista pekingensis TaxID=201185 RepID=A0ABW2KNY4_9PROT
MPDSLFRFRAEDAVALCLVDVANALSRQSEAILEQAGLTAPQWTVLLNVAGDANFHDETKMTGSIFSSEIAAARGLSRPHISATVTELIRKGLIRQDDDPQDRRRKLLSVTGQGLAVLRRLQPLRQSVNDMLLADLSPTERERLLHTLLTLRQRARAADHVAPALKQAS